MKSTHTFLVLCALRFMRKIIALKDEFYNRYIVKGNLFDPVVEAFLRNNGRYNLLDSAILELFEFIKLEDVKSLCSYVVESFGKILDDIEYVQTFKALRTRYDQHQDRLKDRDRTSLDGVPSILRNSRYHRDQRQLEEEEEMWFNEEEEFEDTGDSVVPANKMDTELDTLGKIIDKKSTETNGPARLTGVSTNSSSPTKTGIHNNNAATGSPKVAGAIHNNNPSSSPPSGNSNKGSALFKKGLVDYEGDSDEEEEEEGGSVCAPVPKRARLT